MWLDTALPCPLLKNQGRAKSKSLTTPTAAQNKYFKEAMLRYGLADNSIVDYLYISNKMYLGQPSKRLQVSAAYARFSQTCT